MRIVIAGGTGFIGGYLIPKLSAANHQIVLLSRNPEPSPTRIASPVVANSEARITTEWWDGTSVGRWAETIDGADAVINLAGESIAGKRWTRARKLDLLNSRIFPTRSIVEAIRRARKRPSVMVNASAVGYYGNVETGDVRETHPKGYGFLANLCARWEDEARAAEGFGVRVVRLRFGIILDKEGVALKKLLPPFRLFAGGWLGSGRQWFPWVHREDVIGMIEFALGNGAISGPVNVAAPEPVTMKEFCQSLGKALNRPCWAPVPGFILRVALGELSGMLLTGQRVVPRKALEAGYTFRYPSLPGALAAIFSPAAA
jgi:uncharacterized protein (TIGR01777 family)